MKPHLVIRLIAPTPQPVPHWEDVILDKSSVVESLGPDLDRVFQRHGVAIWVTSEYPLVTPDSPSNDERATGLDRTYRVILTQGSSVPRALLEELRNQPSVSWVRSGVVGRTTIPTCSRQASRTTDWPAEMIRLSYAHAFSTGDASVTVAVLDTGIDANHVELPERLARGKDCVDFEGFPTSEFLGDLFDADDDPFDEVGHGTHVAGIIAGRGRAMPEGVSPDCSLMAVRVLAAMNEGGRRVGAGLVDNINVGIKWAVDNGADVINMSLGIRHAEGGLPHADVVDYAHRRGVTVVAAAGNDGTANKYFPGALPGVVAVGAVDRSGGIADFSSFGARISVLAPGTEILSSYRDGGYAASSGTSQAAPFVSGAVGLLKSIARQHRRELGPRDIIDVLTKSSDRVDRQRHHPRGGHGVINLADAVRYLHHQINTTQEFR